MPTIAGGQTPLQDLFNRVQQRNAQIEAEKQAASPFGDDRSAPLPGGAARRPVTQPLSEVLPAPRVEGKLPLAATQGAGDVQLTPSGNGLISLVVRDASLSRVLALLAQTQHLNIVAANDIDALISITLRDVPLEEALTAILSVANYTWVERNGIILVTSLNNTENLPPDVQGRQIQVFDLDFASADAVAEAVTNFLSPIGKVTTSKSDSTNNRRTRELVIVEDVPESVARIAAYIRQVDCPPRQVLIEAHVLQVALDDTCKCGVDFNALGLTTVVNSTTIVPRVATNGLASATASPAFVATLGNADFGTVINLLQTTTDAKSLGSPKLLVLNGQQARIQVGKQDGYKTTTTTETSTTEQVQFLNTGVILTIMPRITRDCRVLLHVKPEVSDGAVSEKTGLPSSKTAELETDVMLRDGEGMIIGGLIREEDRTEQKKVPYLGEVKGLGWFFRDSTVVKQRDEVVIGLVPRIQPYSQQYYDYEQGELVKAGVPLFDGPLVRNDRPWDPILPDGKRVYRRLLPWQNRGDYWPNRYGSNGEYVIPPQPLPQQKFYAPPCGPQPQPLLSDEALPVPAGAMPAQQDGTIVTDQE
jgi:type IV pilus assembly protein PilQ